MQACQLKADDIKVPTKERKQKINLFSFSKANFKVMMSKDNGKETEVQRKGNISKETIKAPTFFALLSACVILHHVIVGVIKQLTFELKDVCF